MLLSNSPNVKNTKAVSRITALWAFAESGLGGVLFALHIPLTGFLLGALSVIFLTLIAFFSQNNFRAIVQSTLLVLLVKATVSPHSSPAAYIAVGFQGLLAAVIFSTLKKQKLSAVLLGVISMAESALQKIILLTFFFGKKLWEAVDIFFGQIAKELQLSIGLHFVEWMIGGYVIIYMFWGALVGNFAAGIPTKIDRQKEKVLFDYNSIHAEYSIEESAPKSHRLKQVIVFIFMLAFICLVFLFFGKSTQTIWWIIARSIGAILLFYLVIGPVLQWLLRSWLLKKNAHKQESVKEIMSILPEIKYYTGIAYDMAKSGSGTTKKLKTFITNLIILSLYAEHRK